MSTRGVRQMATGVTAVGIVVLAGACGNSDDGGEPSDVETVMVTALGSIAESCRPDLDAFFITKDLVGEDDPLASEFVLTIGDGGSTVTISNPMREVSYLEEATVIAMTCMLEGTQAPDSVKAEVSQSTAMTGRQEAEWNDIHLSYGFAGGTGVSAVFTTN